MLCVVHEIRNIHYCRLLKTMPPMLSISVDGMVPTGGWSNAQLSPWIYIKQPSDGVQDFTMYAEPPAPGTIVSMGFAVVNSAPKPFFVPVWIKGVRIHASSNKLEWLFDDKKKVGDEDPVPLNMRLMPWLGEDAAK